MGAVPGVYYQGDNNLQGNGMYLQGGNSPQNAADALTIQPANTSPFQGVFNPQANQGASFVQGAATGTTGNSVDPFAAYGGRAAYNSLISNFNTQKSNIYGTASDAARNAGIGLKGSILDFVDALRGGQRQIDNAAINNEITKRQGTQTVLDMVGRGIRSGGVMLANKNASDSSAAGALARAYGDIGRRNLSQVGNQYEMQNRNIGQQQLSLDEQRASGMRKIGDSKEQIIGNIVAEARNGLAALDAAMAGASLPDRIAIEQEKENLKRQIIGQLSQFDELLAQQTSTVNPMSAEGRMSEANRLISLGQAPESAFDFSTEAPAQFQNSGPYPTQLPIFLSNKKYSTA